VERLEGYQLRLYLYSAAVLQALDHQILKASGTGMQVSVELILDSLPSLGTAAAMLDLLNGKTPETNATYANGVMDVPSYNCTPVFADVNNYAELLVESGYYTAEQLAE